MNKVFLFSILLSLTTNSKKCGKLTDSKISVIGIALNDKDGAIVKTDSSYYLVGELDEWDERYYKRKVRVAGTLKREMRTKTSTDSVWVQERVDTWLIIKKAKWYLVE